MGKQGAELDRVFAALADPTRRALLARLRQGEACVTELAAPQAMSLPAVSKHLRVLETAGLVERQVVGRTHHLQLRAGPLDQAVSWLEKHRRFWGQRLLELDEFLASEPDRKGSGA